MTAAGVAGLKGWRHAPDEKALSRRLGQIDQLIADARTAGHEKRFQDAGAGYEAVVAALDHHGQRGAAPRESPEIIRRIDAAHVGLRRAEAAPSFDLAQAGGPPPSEWKREYTAPRESPAANRVEYLAPPRTVPFDLRESLPEDAITPIFQKDLEATHGR
jgi:hypothetical protein